MSEKPCSVIHSNVEEAIKHTEAGLVKGNKLLLPEPYWGTRGGEIANAGKVIGWMSSDKQLRWRLDYDHLKGVHINEEDFIRGRKIVHPIRISYIWAATYWEKWTSRFDKPDYVIAAEEEILRQRREGFK
jgi:hypothetical protein